MLSTEFLLWSAIFIACGSLLIALAAIIIAQSSARYARACADWARNLDNQREPESRIAALSSEMTELSDAYAALLRSHKKLRSRITMRENREKGSADDDPDLSSGTDKRQLRLAAKSAGLLK